MQNEHPITAQATAGRRERPVVALVVPCYNEEEMLPVSAPQLLALLDAMVAEGIASADSFILCVDDGSRDGTWELICRLHSEDNRLKGITLAHNRGQQSAMLAGLMTVRPMADAAITIDADLQDSPQAVVEMVRLYRRGYDIVYGVRASRSSDSFYKRASARAFYKLQSALGLETIYDHSEFRLMGRRALDILEEYPERNLFIRGIMTSIGLKWTTVTYDRCARAAGETKYSFGKLLSLSVDGITSFTAKPMRLIFGLGLVLLMLDVVISAWVLIYPEGGKPNSGWASMMLSIWFLGSIILIALGIIGEYVGKIFTEVKRRPRYNIAESLMD